MDFAGYAAVWRIPGVRQAVLLSALGKAPSFAATLIVTLHVVGVLGEGYSAAGLVAAVFTIAIGVASPLRGRLLDRIGLRRTLLPSLVVLPLAFCIAPFVPLVPLLVVVAVAGLLAVPWFPLTRQILLAAVAVEQRRTVLALDSVVTELAFMVGPILGTLAAVYGDTRWALPLFGGLSVLAAAELWRRDPPLASEDAHDLVTPGRRVGWLTPKVIGLFIITAVAAFILGGQDLTIVAAMRALDSEALLGVAMAAWGGGSLVGGLVYGAVQRDTAPVATLAFCLALVTFPAILAADAWALIAFLVVMGLFCAPTMAAAAEAIADAVPASRRGEAMGWQGTWSTTGNAVAPPLVGYAIDQHSWQAGFWATGLLGILAVGLAGALIGLGRRRLAQKS